MPYYREQLLSVWPSSQLFEVGKPPIRIDPAILKTAHPNDVGVWLPNPRKCRRNQAENTRIAESAEPTITAPKFLSEKAREPEWDQTPDSQTDDLQDSLANTILNGSTKSDVPVMYRNVEIKYSRFGVDDFDFE